jgi:hypothetical protein
MLMSKSIKIDLLLKILSNFGIDKRIKFNKEYERS